MSDVSVSTEGGARVCSHAAPVCGRRIVFASVEYPQDTPPECIVIEGMRYVREDVRVGDSERV